MTDTQVLQGSQGLPASHELAPLNQVGPVCTQFLPCCCRACTSHLLCALQPLISPTLASAFGIPFAGLSGSHGDSMRLAYLPAAAQNSLLRTFPGMSSSTWPDAALGDGAGEESDTPSTTSAPPLKSQLQSFLLQGRASHLSSGSSSLSCQALSLAWGGARALRRPRNGCSACRAAPSACLATVRSIQSEATSSAVQHDQPQLFAATLGACLAAVRVQESKDSSVSFSWGAVRPPPVWAASHPGGCAGTSSANWRLRKGQVLSVQPVPLNVPAMDLLNMMHMICRAPQACYT